MELSTSARILRISLPKVAATKELDLPDFLSEKNPKTRCLKITEKVSFNIASEASYVYIIGPFWRDFENLKLAVKQCYQTCQF